MTDSNTIPTENDVMLSPEEAAQRIGMSVSWLAKQRARGGGPRFVKYGRSVKYPLSYRNCSR